MASGNDTNPDIQDLITHISAVANNKQAATLPPTQKQELLAATRSLTETLESPDTVIWKVVFGVILSYPPF